MVNFFLGNIQIPSDRVPDFIYHEQIDRFSYGKIIIIDRGGDIINGLSIPGGVRLIAVIEEGNYKEVIDTYIYDYVAEPREYGYDLYCDIIMYSEEMRHYAIVKPSVGIKNMKSNKALEELFKRANISYTVNGNVTAADSMNWIIANSNIQMGIDHILSRSYVSDNDALLISSDNKGVMTIGTYNSSLDNPLCTMTHIYGIDGLINGGDKDNLTVIGYSIRSGSGSRNAIYNGNMVKTISDYSNGTIQSAGDKLVSSELTNSPGVVDQSIKEQLLVYDTSYMDKINVHKNYWKSGQIRNGIMGACSYLLECTSAYEPISKVGYSAKMKLLSLAENNAHVQSKFSGVYIVIRKTISYKISSPIVSCSYSMVRPNSSIDKSKVKAAYGSDAS
jgi:hypothetical protein